MKQEHFTRKMFYRFLAPSLVCSAALAFGNIVDALVVGARMGEAGLAAINLVLPIYMVFNVFDIGLSVGGSIEYARLLGEGRAKAAKVHFNRMLMAALFISILFAVLGNLFLPQILYGLGATAKGSALYQMSHTYAKILVSASPLFFLNFLLYYFIRNDDNQKLASIGFVVGNALDIVLNYVFVILMDYGIAGAVWSTVIGQAASIAVYLPHLFIKHNILGLQAVRPDLGEIFKSFRIGLSTSNQYMFQFMFLLLANNILMRISGEGGVAILDVVLNTSFVALCFFEAMVSTLQPLASTFTGEKNKSSATGVLRMSFFWGMGLSASLILVIAIFSADVCGIFGLRENTALGGYALRLVCAGSVFAGVSMIMSAYYQSSGQAKWSFTIGILRNFILLLPLTVAFGFTGSGLFWWVFPITEAASLAVWALMRRLSRAERTARAMDETRIYNRIIENKDEDIGMLISDVQEFCDKWDADAKQSYYVTMTVEEICQSIIKNAFGPRGGEYIHLTLIAGETGEFELHIRDNATTFNPFDMITKKVEINDTEKELDSLGILMIKNKAKDFFYRRYQGFNTLTVRV